MKGLYRLALIACVFSVTPCLYSHEVDHYELDSNVQLADLGPYWNQLLHQAIANGAARANESPLSGEQNVVLKDTQSFPLECAKIAESVRHGLPNSLVATPVFEREIKALPLPEGNGFQNLYYAPMSKSIYGKFNWVPDPRFFNRASMLRSSLVKIHGHYLGTDKIVHFFGMGHLNYQQYFRCRSRGMTQEEALKEVVQWNRRQAFSEHGVCGAISTGIYSNADMAANYVGTKFYINLTEPVHVNGRLLQPMLQRVNNQWVIDPEVETEPNYFAQFVCDHFDEALNPCIYEWTFRQGVKGCIKERSQQIIEWYARDNPEARQPSFM